MLKKSIDRAGFDRPLCLFRFRDELSVWEREGLSLRLDAKD